MSLCLNFITALAALQEIITGQYFDLRGIDWFDLFEELLLNPHKNTPSCVLEFVESLLWKSPLTVQEFFSQHCTLCARKKQLISASFHSQLSYPSGSKCCCSYGQRPGSRFIPGTAASAHVIPCCWLVCGIGFPALSHQKSAKTESHWAVTSGREGCRCQCRASQSLLLIQEMQALPDTPMQGEMLRWI